MKLLALVIYIKVIDMLYTRSGTPGSGKSYNAVQDICKLLRKNNVILTNIPLQYNQICKLTGFSSDFVMKRVFVFDNEEFSPRFLFKWGLLVANTNLNITLILDEAGDLFNSREWQRKDRLNWLKFFRMSRHLKYDVCLIAQSRKQLDSQIRDMFDTDYQYRKVKHFGFIGFLLYYLFRPFGKLCCCLEVYVPVKSKSSFKFFLLHKSYYKAYDSFTLDNYINDFMDEEEINIVFNK